jgi:hypothetical protein
MLLPFLGAMAGRRPPVRYPAEAPSRVAIEWSLFRCPELSPNFGDGLKDQAAAWA